MTHPGNLFIPPVELLPCPVCGKSAESVFRYSDPDGFVVWCQDAFCSVNRDEPFDTKEEACAAWNDPVRRADICSRIKPVQLLPCPVCGALAELHQTDDDSKSFVVFCSDSHCAGNQAPACSTAEEAAAAWNKLAVQPYRWYKTCCPCCGWCEADEKGFKEHLATLPKPSRWERLVRRINWHGILTDAYWMCCMVVLLQAFESFLKLNGITSGFTLLSPYLRTILLFAAPLYFIRIVYAIISKRLLMREFDACLSSSESTTTPPPTKENHHV